MLTQKEFSIKTGLSYPRVLAMCKNGELEVVNKTNRNGAHFNIPKKEVAKFQQPENYISRDEYEKVIRENERLKTMVLNFKTYIASMDV